MSEVENKKKAKKQIESMKWEHEHDKYIPSI